MEGEDLIKKNYRVSPNWPESRWKKEQREKPGMTHEEHQALLKKINHRERPELSYEEFYRMIVRRLKAVIPAGRRLNYDPRNHKTCRLLIKYWMNMEGEHEGDQCIEPWKSLVLWRNVGTGKTEIIKQINYVAKEIQYEYSNPPKVFYFVDFKSLIERIEDQRDPSLVRMHYPYNTIYDDFAHEGVEAMVVFKGRTNVVERIVRNHYINKKRPLKVYVMNHSYEQIEEKYGAAVAGWIREIRCAFLGGMMIRMMWYGERSRGESGSLIFPVGRRWRRMKYWEE